MPFGAFKTYQTKIAEIERLTGLKFVGGGKGSLRTFDPLENKPAVRRRRSGTQESTRPDIPDGYYEIAGPDDIQT